MPNRRPRWPLWVIILVLLIYGISQQVSQRESPSAPDRAAGSVTPEPEPATAPPAVSAIVPTPTAPVISGAAPSFSPGDRLEPPVTSIDTSGNARVGNHVTVSINLDSKAIAMRTVLIRLQFDRSKLRLAWATAGEVMMQAGITSSFAYEVRESGETEATLSADNDAAVSGAGSVAVFDFEAIAEGTADVTLLLLEIRDMEGKVVQGAIAGPQYITIEP